MTEQIKTSTSYDNLKYHIQDEENRTPENDRAYIIALLEIIAWNTSVDNYDLKRTRKQALDAHRAIYGVVQPSTEHLQETLINSLEGPNEQ